jgi:hypothetical protein
MARTLALVTRLRSMGILIVLVAASMLATGFADADGPPASALSAAAGPRATASLTPASPRAITLVNRTRVVIWPAAWPGSLTGHTGWRLAPGAQLTFMVPGDWNARL